MKRLSYVGLFTMLFLIGCGKEKGQSEQCPQKFINEYREVGRCYSSFIQKRIEYGKTSIGFDEVKKEKDLFISKYNRLKTDFPQIKNCNFDDRNYDMLILENKAKDAEKVIAEIELCQK